MSVEDNTSPKFGLNHPFNTGLGIPIARQSDDAQGTLTLLFKEMKMSSGDPSERILALTNKHVASVDITSSLRPTLSTSSFVVIIVSLVPSPRSRTLSLRGFATSSDLLEKARTWSPSRVRGKRTRGP
jgi:hypothetical protein